MIKKTNILWTMATAVLALFSACTSEDGVLQENERVPIMISTAISPTQPKIPRLPKTNLYIFGGLNNQARVQQSFQTHISRILQIIGLRKSKVMVL